MRLVSYGPDLRGGVVEGGRVYDAAQLAGLPDETKLSTVDLLSLNDSERRRIASGARHASPADAVGEEGHLLLGPPIPCPSKILCIGMNYRDHAAEGGHATPSRPEV